MLPYLFLLAGILLFVIIFVWCITWENDYATEATATTNTGDTAPAGPTTTRAPQVVNEDTDLPLISDLNQIFPKRDNPASNWRVTISNSTTLQKPIEWWPDSAQMSIRNGSNTKWLNITSYAENYRWESNSPFPNGTRGNTIAGWMPCHGGQGFNNGGIWFMSVYRLKANRLVAFVHFEARPHGCPGPTMKSLGVMYSNDDGNKWTPPQQVISDTSWLDDPMWGGVGDGSVVRDYHNKRWVFIFHHGGGLSGAMSMDEEGKAGSWKIWDGNAFTLSALNSNRQARRTLPGLNIDGANPQIHWNTYLQKYVLVYHAWADGIYCSASDDAVHWSGLKQIIRPNQFGRPRPWYPTVFSDWGGSNFCGKTGKLLIANCEEGCQTRDALLVDITFVRTTP